MACRHVLPQGFLLSAPIIMLISMAAPAYGHGIGTDLVPPIRFQDRDITIFVKITPAFMTEGISKGSIEVTLKDANTGKVIPHATFLIKLDKDGRTLLSDMFHSHDGRMVLEVRPTDSEKIFISAFRDPNLGWIASEDAAARAVGPVLLDGGLYHFTVDVLSLEEDRLRRGLGLKFEAYVSIGETTTYPIDGEELRIRTMYEKIQDFDYDDANNMLRFSMPFNWDRHYLILVPVVHEELIVPRTFSAFVAESYTATVNGIELPDDALVIDNTNPDFITVHYMLMNKHLLPLSVKVTDSPEDVNIATFTLEPSGPRARVQPVGQMVATSSGGSFTILLSMIPETIEPSVPTTFTMNFLDAETKLPVSNVSYDFMLFKEGGEILKMTDQRSISDIGIAHFTFTESQTGSVMLKIDRVANTEESVEFSINVVPEFPLSVLTVMAGAAVASMLLLARFSKLRR